MKEGKIRPVKQLDAESITYIYNEYVVNTTISFEITPVSVKDMQQRIREISSCYPFLVYENADGEILGYCYAHKWKERAAYDGTVETTIYCSKENIGNGIGTKLMHKLISECKHMGYSALIACITGDNIQSIEFHEKLGFNKVSHFKKVGTKFGQKLDVCDFELLI